MPVATDECRVQSADWLCGRGPRAEERGSSQGLGMKRERRQSIRQRKGCARRAARMRACMHACDMRSDGRESRESRAGRCPAGPAGGARRWQLRLAGCELWTCLLRQSTHRPIHRRHVRPNAGRHLGTGATRRAARASRRLAETKPYSHTSLAPWLPGRTLVPWMDNRHVMISYRNTKLPLWPLRAATTTLLLCWEPASDV